MTTKFKNGDAGGINHCESTLASGLAIGATSATLAAGTGNRFPTVIAPDVAYVTIQNATYYEIVKITARALGSDTLTIERAQEGTNDRAWLAGDVVSMRLTAAQAESAVNAQAVAQAALVAHEAAANPHPDYTTTAELAAYAQPVNANLTAVAGMASARALELAALSSFMGGLLNDADEAAARATLGAANEVQCAHTTSTVLGVTTRIPRPLSAGLDFDTILDAGTYNFDASASANAPVAGLLSVFLDVYRHTNTTVGSEYMVQVCWDMNAVNTAPRAWVRKATPGLTWTGWHEILGANRTWHSGLLGVGGRTSGATVVNTNRHDIVVQVSGYTPAAADVYGTITIAVDTGSGFVQAGFNTVTSRGSSIHASANTTVPAGASYKVSTSGITLGGWAELY